MSDERIEDITAKESVAAAPQTRRSMRQRWRKPDPQVVRQFAARVPFIWVWAIVVGLAALQIYFDPFGFSRLTQRYSQDLVNLTLTGPLYPDIGREQVSVALIEDDTLGALEKSWPISFGDHAQVLDALLAYGPRAVAVDLLFVDRRNDPSIEQLQNVIARYQRANVPLYFAGSSRAAPVLPEIAQSGPKIVDALTRVDDGVSRQYPLTVPCVGEREAEACPSFAVQIYEDLSQARVAPGAAPETNLELVWGVDSHPTNRKWRRVQTEDGELACPEEPGILVRLYRAVLDVASLRAQPLCPHTGIIPVEKLMRGEEDPDFPGLIGNHVIFYGADLEGSADRAYTPSNGLLARVFIHAMALDNLFTFAGKPKLDSVTVADVTISKNEMELVTIALILLIVTSLHIRRIRTLGGAEDEDAVDLLPLHSWAWYGLLVGMVVFFGILLYVGVGLSIGNWVELVFISGLLFQFLASPYLARLWGRVRYAIGV
jgi:CHASE2 domain-containing sensor protein